MSASFRRRAASLATVAAIALTAAGCGKRTTFYDTAAGVPTPTTWAAETELAQLPVYEFPETTVPPVEPPPPDLPGESSGPAVRPVSRKAAPASLKVTGRIEIPKIGLAHTTYEGNTLREIDHGPSHWPGTPMPGHPGNTVFPGHRTTHSRPFHDLDRLAAGDQIIFTTAQGRFVYEVFTSFIVRPHEVWIVHPTKEAMVTLFACHPKGSASQRFVVRGRLVSAPVAAPAKHDSPQAHRPPPPPPPTTTTTAPPRRSRCTLCLP